MEHCWDILQTIGNPLWYLARFESLRGYRLGTK
uniref:Uncharacterized protein n=1 Tax=Siphoviridae sp. ctC6Q17 TaxID=2827271 RepID=A0A8S5R3R1_9CAUD|nr:MAG TPA: hypothetical protein [Siphoviridae sp. ctC6Q17]